MPALTLLQHLGHSQLPSSSGLSAPQPSLSFSSFHSLPTPIQELEDYVWKKKMYEEGFNRPEFLQLMVGEFINSMRIPRAFVRYIYGQNVPGMLLLKPEKGKPTRVGIEKRDGGCFFDNRWAKFVEEQRLKHGDLLVFSMIDESSFGFTTLGKNCCSTNLKSYVVEHQEEQGSPMEVIKDEERAREEGESSKAAVQRTRRVKKQNKVVMPKTEPSSFEVTLQGYNRYELCVPKQFMEAAGLKSKTTVVLKCSNGDKWAVKLRLERLPATERMRFASGWVEFYKDNMLKLGDTLLFHMVPGTPNEISVQIFRARSSKKQAK